MNDAIANLPENWEELIRVATPTEVLLDPFAILATREANYPGFVSQVVVPG